MLAPARYGVVATVLCAMSTGTPVMTRFDVPEFSFSPVSIVALPTLGGVYSEGIAINDRGEILAMSENLSGFFRAMVWDRGQVFDVAGDTIPRDAFPIALNNQRQVLGWFNAGPLAKSTPSSQHAAGSRIWARSAEHTCCLRQLAKHSTITVRLSATVPRWRENGGRSSGGTEHSPNPALFPVARRARPSPSTTLDRSLESAALPSATSMDFFGTMEG
jgi:hypothetical protein